MSEKLQKRLAFIINVAFFAVVLTLVYVGFKHVLGWVLPFVLAFCIVSLIHPLIRLIDRHMPVKKEILSLLVMIIIYAVVALLLITLITQLVILIRDALVELPAYYENALLPALTRTGESLMNLFHRLPPEWQERFSGVQGEIIGTLQTFLLNLSQKGLGALSGLTARIPSFLIAFLFTIMLSFFISMQYDKVTGFLRDQMSPRVKRVMRDLRHIIKDTVFKYLRATLTLIIIMFVELSIGLMVLGTHYAIPIAAGIAVFDALPIVGTGTILVTWSIIELIQGNFAFAVGLLILYGIVTVIRNIIEPKIVGDKLGLNPIVSLTAIYLGFKLMGVIGMIVMPIFIQIAVELHRSGAIHLFRDGGTDIPDRQEES